MKVCVQLHNLGEILMWTFCINFFSFRNNKNEKRKKKENKRKKVAHK